MALAGTYKPTGIRRIRPGGIPQAAQPAKPPAPTSAAALIAPPKAPTGTPGSLINAAMAGQPAPAPATPGPSGVAPMPGAPRTAYSGGTPVPQMPFSQITAGMGTNTRMPGQPTAARAAGGGTPMVQVPQPAPMPGQQNIYGTKGQSNMPATPQFNPYQGQNLPQMPVSNEFRNTLVDYQFMKEPQVGDLNNPYANVTGGAQRTLQQLLAGGGYEGGGNQFTKMGQNLLNGQVAQPGVPNAPTLERPGQATFDPSKVAKPNVTMIDQVGGDYSGPQVRDVNAGNAQYQGPDVVGNDLERLLGLAGQIGGQGTSVPRENLTGSGYEADPLLAKRNEISLQSLLGGTEAARGLASGDIINPTDLSAARKQVFDEAAQAGLEAAVGRGSTDPRGFAATGEIGNRLGSAASKLALEEQDRLIRSAEANASARQGGISALLNAGGTAGNQAVQFGGLRQGETQDLNQLKVTERGQDVNLAQTNAGNAGRGVGDLASLINAVNQGQIGGYGEATTRGLGERGQNIEAGKSNQEADIAKFREGTTRGTGQGNLDLQRLLGNQEAEAKGYQNETDRIRAEGGIETDLAGINSNNINNYNQATTDLFKAVSDANSGAFNAGTQRLQTLLSGTSDFAQLVQNGDVEAGRQAIQLGGLAEQIMAGDSNAQVAYEQLRQQVGAQNADRLLNMALSYRQGFISRNPGNTGGAGAALGALVGGIGGSFLGPIGTAGGAAAGKAIFGG